MAYVTRPALLPVDFGFPADSTTTEKKETDKSERSAVDKEKKGETNKPSNKQGSPTKVQKKKKPTNKKRTVKPKLGRKLPWKV